LPRANATLTPKNRLLLARCVVDDSCFCAALPRRPPRRARPQLARRIRHLRRWRGWGSARIGHRLRVAPPWSTGAAARRRASAARARPGDSAAAARADPPLRVCACWCADPRRHQEARAHSGRRWAPRAGPGRPRPQRPVGDGAAQEPRPGGLRLSARRAGRPLPAGVGNRRRSGSGSQSREGGVVPARGSTRRSCVSGHGPTASRSTLGRGSGEAQL
jgi:hypothetical protein